MAISQQNFWGCTLSAHPQSYQHEKPPVNLLFYDGVWNIETVILMGHQILIRQFCGVWNFVHKIKNILHPGVALTLWPLPYITIIWLITEHFQYDFNFRADCSVSLFCQQAQQCQHARDILCSNILKYLPCTGLLF